MTQSFVEEQSAPVPNDKPASWDLVIADMRARDAVGRERYGTPLQPGNGRDSLVDAYQEVLDTAVYIRNAIAERGAGVPSLPHREAMAEEIRRLRAQVTELQAGQTRLVEENRALRAVLQSVQSVDRGDESSQALDVKRFCVIAGQEIGSSPHVPSDETVRLRMRLIIEEACLEMMLACFPSPGSVEVIKSAWMTLLDVINRDRVKVDLPAFADATIDTDYVIEGARVVFGINGRPLWNAVHAANMAKMGGHRDEYGKLLKPPGWKPPPIEDLLKEQGWTP